MKIHEMIATIGYDLSMAVGMESGRHLRFLRRTASANLPSAFSWLKSKYNEKQMHLLKITAAGAFVACLCGASIAGEANPIEMAHGVGFVGCDSLIAREFEHAMTAPQRRFQINYFNETARNSVDLLVTFGRTGDTVWQTVHFEKIGGYCYSAVRTMISEEGNCAGHLSKDQYFKYMYDSAGALWTENEGGVDKLFIQSGDTCNMIFARTNKEQADR